MGQERAKTTTGTLGSRESSSSAWWRTAVIYQIYPRSFQDTSGDGVGDLPGITSRLDYLSNTLGVDAIWVSPFFPSPMADFGYDVSDYTDVDPTFGTLDDATTLIASAHGHDLKVIIDWVPNHSSDQHPWFIDSRSSRDNPKRDWYVWRDPAPEGGPPNNWLSLFGGPAWELDDATGQYYLHSFLKEQPELNWRNPDLEAAMVATLRFWLDRGVDGFRVDVAHFLAKDPAFRSNPSSASSPEAMKDHHEYATQEHLYDKAHPDIHAVHRRIREVLDEYEDTFSIGEIHEFDWVEWAKYFGNSLDELHMPQNFSMVWADWTASGFRDRIVSQEEALPQGAWPNHVFGNHDEPRLSTRLGPHRIRAAAVMLLTLRGTPTMYYGDELGLVDGVIELGQEQDPWGRKHPDLNRDMCRTPMQWTVDGGMGFTTPGSRPWLPFADPGTSVASQLDEPESTLSLYRELLTLRRTTPELMLGDVTMIDSTNDNVLVYERTLSGSSTYVAVNFTDEEQDVEFPTEIRQALSSVRERSGGFSSVTLLANEAIIAR